MATNKGKYQKRKRKALVHKLAARVNSLASSDNLKRPKNFASLTDVITYSKGAVYSITRMRQVNNLTYTGTIGTGFLCAPNRFLTCAHVVKNSQSNEAFSHHADGDTYYLLSKDEDGKEHWHILTPQVSKDLHIYPEIDVAIFELGDDFYYRQNKILQSKQMYIPLCAKKNVLATDVSVIGYPLEKDKDGKDKGVYIEQSTNKIIKDNIRMRADKGVVNASYKDAEDNDVAKYEFTMAFNPGNSGGPILNADGCAVAIVHGYKAFPIKVLAENFTKTNKDGTKENMTIPSTIRATYSIGISSENFLETATKHQLKTC